MSNTGSHEMRQDRRRPRIAGGKRSSTRTCASTPVQATTVAASPKIQRETSTYVPGLQPARRATTLALDTYRERGPVRTARLGGNATNGSKPLADNRLDKRCRPDMLRILTYNLGAGGLGADRLTNSNGHRLHLLMEDLKQIHWPSETRCAVEHHATWTDGAFILGAAILLGARDATANIGGVGFIVHQNMAKYVRSVSFISHRTAVLKLDIPGQRKPLKVIQVYAPHSNYADEDAEHFYEKVCDQLADSACRTVLIGDFNARIGRGCEDERFVGPYSAEERNARGDRMAAFAESQRLYVMNTWFKKPKKKRWTWHSPRYETLSEIDYILCDDKTSISNVEILSNFACKSDHKPVRATLKLNVKRMKKSLALSSHKHGHTFDAQKLKQAVRQADWTLSERLNEQYEKLTTTLAACLEDAENLKERCKSRLTEETRKLMEDLTTLKGTPANATRLQDLDRETAEARRSLKKCARDLAQTRLLLPALKDENGIRKTDRREIEDVCRRFYTQLFDSKIAVPRQSHPYQTRRTHSQRSQQKKSKPQSAA